jgi:hypothetical protein
MSQPEASSNRPTLSAQLYKASPGLFIFGNLISLVSWYFGREDVFTHNQIMFNIFLVIHTICFKYLPPPGQSHSSSPNASSTTDREQ